MPRHLRGKAEAFAEAYGFRISSMTGYLTAFRPMARNKGVTEESYSPYGKQGVSDNAPPL